MLLTVLPVGAAEKITLMLDWFPNIDHLPLYVAQQEDYFKDAGLTVQILSPSDTTDALKLAASNNVDLAVSYAPQAIMGASSDLPVKVVGRLVEHPLSVLLFLKGKGIEKPSDLKGKTIGYTVPGMMDILTEAFTKINGIENYVPINVGFSIVQSLTAGKVDAIMGPYKNYETIALEEKGYAAGYFELTQWGIPDYDELVFICGAETLKKKTQAVQSFVHAVERAISETRQNPQKALESYFKAVPEAPRGMETQAFAITLPLYASHQRLENQRWQKFADFALKFGLIEKKVDAQVLFESQME
ncbi:MAG: ABC transporter substrate-binding protein [Desulfobacterales bacterium]|nr:ABC transporter substrate-binding protein [Desulfobacterales bacterium]